MPAMNKTLLIMLGSLVAAAGLLAGCESNIVPMKPLQRIETWQPDEVVPLQPTTTQAAEESATAPATQTASSQPATEPSTQTALTEPATSPATQTADSQPASQPATQLASTEPATQPTTRPGKMIVKIIDPNQTIRYVYHASYDRTWQEAMTLLNKTGFTLDRKDYRLGVLTTQALPSAQIVEPWKRQHAGFTNAMENTLNCQRRRVRLTVSAVLNKPEFYEIAVQVLVERQTNPTETLTAPAFVQGSGFGRSYESLRTDYGADDTEKSIWVLLGHDPKLEKKLLDQLFEKI